MSFTFKENNKFKHIRVNILDIPTQDLEKPLTSGLEVFEFIKEHTNKERYAIKGRGRGSRKIHGNCRDLPIEHSEKIAFYVNERDHIREKEQRENILLKFTKMRLLDLLNLMIQKSEPSCMSTIFSQRLTRWLTRLSLHISLQHFQILMSLEMSVRYGSLRF